MNRDMHSPIEMYFAGNEFFFLNSRSFEVAFRSRGLELKAGIEVFVVGVE